MKLAIFETKISAVKFSERIHTFMTNNRPRYNASEWCKPNKADNIQRWYAKIPSDAMRWTRKFVERIEDDKFIRIANKLPDDWRNEVEPI